MYAPACLTLRVFSAVNLNGYLYEGANTVPFSQYPLEAYTIHGPPAPPAPPAPPSPPSPGTMECNVLALNATLPLYSYEAAFPMVTTVIDGGDWWDIAQIYRQCKIVMLSRIACCPSR